MLLIKRLLILVVVIVCAGHNAVADCDNGGVTGNAKTERIILKTNHGLARDLSLEECVKLGATNVQNQFVDAVSYRLVCSGSNQFKCIPYKCPDGSKLNKNGFCAGVASQDRYHTDAISYSDSSEIQVFDACDSFNAKKTDSGVVKDFFWDEHAFQLKYACISDFADLNVSTPTAIALIKTNNWPNGIGMVSPKDCTIQQNNRYRFGAGRSVRCKSQNNIYVEFLFGNINTLTTSVEDVAEKMCPVFGFVAHDQQKHYCSVGAVYKNNSDSKLNLFKIFLRDAELMDIEQQEGNVYKIVPLRKDKNYNTHDSLSAVLDTDVFKDVVASAAESVKNLVQTYIERQLATVGYKIQNIIFYSARNISEKNTTYSVWPIRIDACNTKNECYTYIKLFKFRSLFGGGNLHVKSLANLSAEMMSCVILDGMFDSKHCFFLEEDISKEKRLCEQDTNNLIKSVFGTNKSAKAYFDNDDKMCVLNSSKQNANVLKTLSVATQIGFLFLTTITTAGAGSVLGMVVLGVGGLADGVALRSEIQMNKASVKFLKKSTRCFDAKCAQKYFEEEFDHMLRLIDTVNDDEFRVIDNEMNRLVELLDDSYVAKLAEKKDKTTGFFANMSSEEVVSNIATIVSLALSIYATPKLIQKLATKSRNVQPKFFKKLGQKIDNLKTTKQSNTANNATPTTGTKISKTVSKRTSKIKDFQIKNIEKIKDNSDISVFKFTDGNTGNVYYLKHTDNFDEITRTKKAYEILGNNSGIVHTVRIIEDDQEVLNALAKKLKIKGSGNFWFVMEEMPGSQTGFHLANNPSALNTVLGGKPITIQEQDEILQAIRKLNDNGIVHGDLGSNMFYMREPNGKLRVDIIDYEPWSAEIAAKNVDIKYFNSDMEEFVKRGLAEPRTIPTAGIQSDTTNIAKTMVAGADNTVLRVENGISFGRWKFDVITDNANNIKYYERAVDGDFQTLAQNLSDEFGKQAIVFERDNEYFIALFDNSDDLDIFVKHEPDIIINGKYSASSNKVSNNNTQMSLNDIENMYQQKLHDDVLALQQTENMDAKIAAYNKLIQRAKNELSPAEYKAFDQMLDLEIANKDLNLRIKTIEQNLRSNNFSEESINMYINDYKVQLSHNQEILGKLQLENKNAAKLLYDNYSTLVDPHYVIRNSNDLVIQKQTDMTYEISKHVDRQVLFDNVKKFKNDIVVNFPEDMYRKARTWDTMPGAERANFIVNDLIPYLQKIQGLEHEKIPVYLQPSSQIGGYAAFCDKSQCFKVSFEAIEKPNFDIILGTLAHESVHAGQYVKGGRSALSKEIVELSDVNYVAAMTNLMANKTNAVEAEAYMTDYLFNNILDEIAAYHNW